MEIDVRNLADQSLEALNGLKTNIPSRDEVVDFVDRNSRRVGKQLTSYSKQSYGYARENPWILAAGVFALGWLAYRYVSRESSEA